MKKLWIVLIAMGVAACQPGEEAAAPAVALEETPATPASAGLLADVLAAMPEEFKQRYAHRHPQETLEFFGIEPGMTVVEALPGSGWYTRVLLPYLGPEGRLIGANYAMDMWPNFAFANEAFMESQRNWARDFPAVAEEWRGANGATVTAFNFGAMPGELAGTADAVLFVRMLHNLARFESEGGFLTEAMADAYNVLKPGGILGVVQHQARDEMSDEFADGSRGYLKRAFVLAAAAAAGFEFVAESDINANPADQPGEDEVVWRLPPSLAGTEENSEARVAMMAIGESHRMTLKFRKPE
ncbi:MAG TPA: hypothetical protein VIS31_01060 [Woeseiaceae bacterium]